MNYQPKTAEAPAEAINIQVSFSPETLAMLQEVLKKVSLALAPLPVADYPAPTGAHPVGAGIGKRLRHARHTRNLTQGELALKAGVDRSNISVIESGANMPREYTLNTLAEALNCDYQWLMTGLGNPGFDLQQEAING